MPKSSSNSKKILIIDVPKLVGEYLNYPVPSSDYTVYAQSGVLGDGRSYQIHVKITTDEDDFFNESKK